MSKKSARNTTSTPEQSEKNRSTYYAHTMPGVEQIAWLEIRKRFPQADFKEYLYSKDKNGIVVFDYDGPASQLLQLRTTEDVFALALTTDNLSRDWGDLRLIADLFERSNLFDQLDRLARQRQVTGQTYRVVTRKEGRHQYRRKDFEQAIIKGLERHSRQTWRLVDEEADVEIWANLIGSRLLCGLRLSDRTMRHRDYKSVHLPASLRPSVAAAMVLLADAQAGGLFLDPMCGGGTILVERLLAQREGQTLGGDLIFDRARASRQNLAAQQKAFLVCRWDACALPLAAESIDRVATNPPFGKQIGSRQDVEKLYPCFMAELARILKPGGLAVVLSSEYDLVKETLRQLRRLQVVRGYAVAVLGQWGRLYILRKPA